MKIIIVGAGITGLSTYHALKTHLLDSSSFPLNAPITIKLVDPRNAPLSPSIPSTPASAAPPSYTSTSTLPGGSLSLAPNGLRALLAVSPTALAHINERAFPGSSIAFCNSAGTYLGSMPFGRAERYGEKFGMSMIPRASVYEALLRPSASGLDEREIGRAKVGIECEWGKKVVNVREVGAQVVLEYEDGSVDWADLVIGADGAQSVVRDALLKGQSQAEYGGLAGVSGLIDIKSLPTRFQEGLKEHGVAITFGRRGYFGYSVCSPLQPSSDTYYTSDSKLPPSPDSSFMQWWAIYESPEVPDPAKIDYEHIKNQLLSVHGGWRSPYDAPDSEKRGSESVFRAIIEQGCQAPLNSFGIQNLGLDTTPAVLPRFSSLTAPHWSNFSTAASPEAKGRIVLLGDAAHIVPADLFQGASCAIEDSLAYALLLKHYLSVSPSYNTVVAKHPKDVESVPWPTPFALAAKAFEEVRRPRIKAITDMMNHSCEKADERMEMGWLGEKLRDWAIRWLGKAPEKMNDYLFAYDTEAAVNEYLAKNASGKC